MEKSKPSEYEQVVQNAAKSFKTFLNVGEEKDSAEKVLYNSLVSFSVCSINTFTVYCLHVHVSTVCIVCTCIQCYMIVLLHATCVGESKAQF